MGFTSCVAILSPTRLCCPFVCSPKLFDVLDDLGLQLRFCPRKGLLLLRGVLERLYIKFAGELVE